MNDGNSTSAAVAAARSATLERTRSIDVGGRRLATTHSGEGALAVVLETGLGAESEEWSTIQRGIAPLARVLRYDRAGRGASDPAPSPRSARELVDDLYALLHAAAMPGPYLLVGHSLGGLLVRLFAQRYRPAVAGLVLVDSMQEDQFDVFGPLFPPHRAGEPPALTEVRRFWTGGWRDPRSTAEGIDLPASCAQGREVTSLGDLPLQVLTAGTFRNQPLIPPAARELLQQKWNQLQERFLSLSANSTQTMIESSGHFVQRDAPQRLIDAIRQMLERVA